MNAEVSEEEMSLPSVRSENNVGIKDDVRKESSGSEDSGVIEIIFEAHAPKIIIPEDSSSDEGYFLLDTGYLAVKVGARFHSLF